MFCFRLILSLFVYDCCNPSLSLLYPPPLVHRLLNVSDEEEKVVGV